MPVHKPVRTTAWFIVGTLALSLLFGSLSVLVALTTTGINLHKDLAAQLPERLSEALRYSFADSEVFEYVDQQIQTDLEHIRIEGLLPVLRACNVGLLQLSEHTSAKTKTSTEKSATSRTISVNWTRGTDIDQAKFLLDCELNSPVLISANLVMAVLLMSCWWLLPAPLSASEKKLHDVLFEKGIPAVYIRQILKKLGSADPESLANNPWFMFALQKYANADINLEAALGLIGADPAVYFHHNSHHVLIHGISIPLPKTPYFYYAWYAMRRRQNINEGWILNPSVDRPDRTQANSLITLMENFGGHQKAINDLKEHGLRSKILDQNRNKIKDELVAVLGEELATGFLFETERDMRSGRHRYRLICQSECIFLSTANS